MREFLMWLLKTREAPFDITLFSVWHFMYIALILGATFGLAYYLYRHKDKARFVLSFLIYALVIVYIADFFAHPLFRSSGNMNIDKLPFHICIVLCPVSAFVQFNKHFQRFKEPVAFLAIVAPLMYITYPGTAIGDVSPFCYEVMQTFLYHGLLFAWGVLMLTTGTVQPSIKRIWQSLVAICIEAVWAGLGNIVYADYDWFFLTGSTFPFVPKPLMPFAVIAAVFGMVAIIYGIYYGARKLLSRVIGNTSAEVDNVEEKEEALTRS